MPSTPAFRFPAVRDRTGLWTRPFTGDVLISAEAAGGAWSDLDVSERDVVLDLGGNIGSAARAFCQAGARVVSYEPDVDNFALLAANAPEAHAIRAAVTATGGDITFHVSPDTPWSHGITPRPGGKTISVPSCAWPEVLTSARPTVVKCDIEGGEYQLDWGLLPSTVRTVGMEVHDVAVDRSAVQAVLDALRAIGFAMTTSSSPATRPEDRVLLFSR